jgi:hypothetical protein
MKFLKIQEKKWYKLLPLTHFQLVGNLPRGGPPRFFNLLFTIQTNELYAESMYIHSIQKVYTCSLGQLSNKISSKYVYL